MNFVFNQKFTNQFNINQFIEDFVETDRMELYLPEKCVFCIQIEKPDDTFDVHLFVESSRTVYVDFECKINGIGKNYYNYLFDPKSRYNMWGWQKFGTKKELFIDEMMTVEWTIKLKLYPVLNLKNVSSDLFADEQFSDFIICCGKKNLKFTKIF